MRDTTVRRFLSPTEVAAEFGLSAQTIRNYCRAGLFPGAVKPSRGSSWLIPVSSVRSFGQQPEPVLTRSSRSRARGRAA
ncbi:helix-turn-helix domain-containing protein [Brachybacterium hainanense]|uniref:Helix-turn-helix domain-containing protein n=1 Tax=Brachybacterium hainanense TaxID=1541174 RepID=A0ABV6R942_9MICO